MIRTLLRRALPLCAALLFGAASASATWSVILINTKTGEIGFAGATCLENDDLYKWLPVVQVGVGCAMTQGLVDISAQDKQLIWNGFLDGKKPVDILADLQASTGTNAKQFAIAGIKHTPVTWSGGALGAAHSAVTGVSGDWKYAVAGNVLTGTEVVLAAANALVMTDGDTAERVMAAMEAARALGGDGRCSCTISDPTGCGVPPAGFTKSAHTAFAGLARIGDPDGICIQSTGCATGDYYMRLEYIGGAGDPDPVEEILAQFATWRAGLAGVPDQVTSAKTEELPNLVADGLSQTTIEVELKDIDGVPIGQGGATLTVTAADGQTPCVTVGAVVDHGDGTYTIPLTAGLNADEDELVITVDDGNGPVTLYPYVPIEVDPFVDMHAGYSLVLAALDVNVPLTINFGPQAAGHPYILLGSASGTSPGISLGSVTLPLNEDWFFHSTIQKAGSPSLPGSIGVLDANGHAQVAFLAPAGLLFDPVGGGKLHWAAVDYDGGALTPTSAADFFVSKTIP